MTCTQLTLTVLTLAALAVGCKPSSDSSVLASADPTARAFDKVDKETTTAVHDLPDYAYAQKAEYVATMQAQLAEINRDLDQLAARIDKAGDAARTEAKPRLQGLRDQVAKLNTHLDVARNASESTWDDVKAGFKQGYHELKDGFNQARQWISDKIAP